MQHRPPQSSFRGGRVPRGIYAYGQAARLQNMPLVRAYCYIELAISSIEVYDHETICSNFACLQRDGQTELA